MAGLAAGITAPYAIGGARAQAAAIQIGMCAPVIGPAAELGLWAQNGAKLALAAVNKAGGVPGTQVELAGGIPDHLADTAQHHGLACRAKRAWAFPSPTRVTCWRPVASCWGGKRDELWSNEAIRAAYLGGHTKVSA